MSDDLHVVTVQELFAELQKMQPGNPVKISDGEKNFTILSIYDGDDATWIDVEEIE